MDERRLVFISSAGSGKTTNLALRYVEILLSSPFPDSFKTITAITFTNRAEREMRERIFKILLELYRGGEDDYLKNLSSFLKEKEKIREILKRLILDYSNIRISTIDSFIRKLSNSSSSFLNIPPDFEVELDEENLIYESIDNLLLSGEREIIERMKKIIEELAKMKSISFNPLSTLKKELLKIEKEYIRRRVKEKFSEDEISRGMEESLKRIKSLCKKHLSPLKKNEKRAEKIIQIFENDKLSPYLLIDSLKDHSISRFLSQCENLRKEVENFVYFFLLYKGNIFSSFAKRLKEFIDSSLKKRRSVLLSELYFILMERVMREEYPDLYFYLGEKIKHYLIDEFQDTSREQWKVLEPLVENSLSEGGTLYIVGDPKQAIYGWRGGDISLILEESKKGKKVYQNSNFRSLPVIVDFNNKVFSPENLKRFFEREELYLHFEGSKQFSCRKSENEGYVFLARAGYGEKSMKKEELREAVRTLLFDGERGLIRDILRRRDEGDVAVLLRKNDDVEEVSRWFLEEKIRVVSHRTLDIRTDPSVGELIDFLSFLSFPPDDLSFTSFISGKIFLTETNLDEREIFKFLWNCRKRNYKVPLYISFKEKYAGEWEEFIQPFFKEAGFFTPYDVVCSFVEKFRKFFNTFPEKRHLFLRFLDILKNLECSGISTLEEFLDYNERASGEIFQLALPPRRDGILITTIHQVKGLSFPVVILPFAFISSFQNPDFLFSSDGEMFHPGDKELRKFCPEVESLMEEQKSKWLREEINLLYVASTRAEDELYIISPWGEKKGTYIYLNFPVTEEMEEELKNNGFYCRGTPLSSQKKEEKTLQIAPFPPMKKDWVKNLKGSRPSPPPFDEEILMKAEEGTIAHSIISKISSEMLKCDEGILTFVEKKLMEFSISEDSREKIMKIIEGAIKTPEIRELLSIDDFLSEIEVIDEEGKIHRVDRIAFKDGEIVLLEFKTGKRERKEDEYQLKIYLSLIGKIYPQCPVKGYIIYLDKRVVHEVKP